MPPASHSFAACDVDR